MAVRRQLAARRVNRPAFLLQIEAIYHTGIVVGGMEYYFGGGIQAAPVGQSPFGEPMQIMDLGVTHLSAAVRAELLDDLSQRYTAESYSLLSNNCSECAACTCVRASAGMFDRTEGLDPSLLPPTALPLPTVLLLLCCRQLFGRAGAAAVRHRHPLPHHRPA